jgi:hypothetical protein
MAVLGYRSCSNTAALQRKHVKICQMVLISAEIRACIAARKNLLVDK